MTIANTKQQPNFITKAKIVAHFLTWAATKSPHFKNFEISFGRLIKTSYRYSEWSTEFWVMQVSLYRPRLYVNVHWQAIEAYNKEFDADVGFLNPDTPF